MRKYIFLLSILISYAVVARESRSLDNGWEFVLSDATIDQLAGVDGWRTVDVPHDWSIEGEFDRSNPSGQGGAYLPAGIGWYRKSIRADFGVDERLFLEFDGVMACSSVFVNGKLAGYRPNGYVGFTYDITDLVTPGKDAVIAVKVDNSVQPASRWYTGSGINRHVRLVSKNTCHIPMNGAFVSFNDGKIDIKTTVANMAKTGTKVSLQYILKDADGKTAARGNSPASQIEAGSQTEVSGSIDINNPHLWSIEDPYLYTLEVSVMEGRKQLDTETVTTGLRTIRFDNEKGFFLNGQNMKMYGVCLHSDAGALGTAVPASVWEYRLQQLRKLGVNAVRMAHNPADPTLMELCDRMGFLVMAESFDTWNTPKNHAEKGYNLYFDEWWEADTRAMVEQARNHPSVVIYSVGNEIRDNLNNEQGFDKYRKQQDLVHSIDPTRPVTMALFRPNSSGVYRNGFAEMMDVVGQNYRVDELKAYHDAHIDYLGEAAWPQVMWSTALLDVTGGFKPAGLQRASWWTKEPMVAFARHADNNGAGPLVSDWTPADMDTYDQAVIEVYSNCQEVDVWINGEPQGRRPMPDNARPAVYNVNYYQGIISIRGYNDGVLVAKCDSVTVGDPTHIGIEKNGGKAGTGFDDVEILSVFIADAEGNICPNYDRTIELKVEGAQLIAVDNADVLAHETSHKSAVFNTYQGRMTAYIRRTSATGKVTVTATDCSSAAALKGTATF